MNDVKSTGHDILIVDDNTTDLKILARILTRHGYAVRPAPSGELALKAVRAAPPDLILLDIVMPEVSGYVVCHRLKEDETTRNIPIIFISALTDVDAQAQAFAAGGVDFIAKPFQEKEVLARVQTHLALQEAQRQLQAQNATLQKMIAEQKQMNLDLIDGEIRYRSLFTNNRAVMLLIDPETAAIVDANPAACAFYRYSKADLTRMKMTDINQLSDEDYHQEMESVLQKKRAYIYSRHQLADDDVRDVEIYSGPITVAGKELLYAIVHDITQRRQAETERMQLAAVIEQASESIIITDTDGKIIYANPFFETLTGYPSAEVIGRNPRILKSGRHGERFYRHLWQAITAGKTWTGVFTNKRKDDTLYQEEATIFPITDANGQIINFAAVKRDISERRRAEAERAKLLDRIRQQAQEMQQIVDAVPEGVIVLGPDNHILLANPAAKRYLAQLAAAEVGDRLTHLGERPLSNLLTPPADDLWHEIEFSGPPARIFELSAQPFQLADARGHILILQDVTRRRERQRRAHQQEKLAVVGQLAAGIAHDFNNIMAVIVLYTQMASRDPNLSSSSQDRLGIVVRQAERATDLIQQILDFSRQSIIKRQPANLVPFVKEMIKLMERTVPENVKIKLHFTTKELWAEVDLTRIQQALFNLAINARDAMPGGGKLDISLDLLTLPPDGERPLPEMTPGPWIQIKFADTGAGISAKELPRIFEPFYTTKKQGEGNGLGLAQVYGIIKQHQGHITVSSEVGVGSTFTIYLPAEERVEPAATTTAPTAFVHGSEETILLVEDDPAAREAMADSLHMLNYQVIVTPNGQEALQTLQEREGDVDLIVSDMVMPDMGGEALLQKVHHRYPDLKVLIVTGYPMGKSMAEMEQKGIVGWMQKPINLEDLSRRIATILAQDKD